MPVNSQIKIQVLVLALPPVIGKGGRVGTLESITLKFDSHEDDGTMLSITVCFTSNLKNICILDKIFISFIVLTKNMICVY